MNDLQQLEEQVARDLHMIRYPERDWIPTRFHASGAPAYDVIVVGGGHCGLTAAFGLKRERIHNILLLEANEPGQQGPWCTYARMITLRSPKHFNGPDLDIPSLTCQAWYEARYGRHAWESFNKIPKEHWQEYLLWFGQVVGLPIRYRTQVKRVRYDGGGLFRLDVTGEEGGEALYARKVVFATGAEGSGDWHVPEMVTRALPKERYALVTERLDFERLAGQRIAVLGGGASAYDNAATALEQGAGEVRLFFRRPRLHRVNPHHWTEFCGFLNHFCDLDDAWRWRFMNHILPLREPPPPETFRRATRHANFHLHLGSEWQDVALEKGEIRIQTSTGTCRADFVIVATGLVTDLRLRPEITDFVDQISLWRDRYTPPPGEENPGLEDFPYLGRHFEYIEKRPGSAPFLKDLYNFTAGATVSQGPSGASINGMKFAVRRIVEGISRDFFLADAETHYQSLLAFDRQELDVPWPEEPLPVEGLADRDPLPSVSLPG